MKKLIAIIFIAFLLTSCEYPISKINEWWRYDVLQHTEDEKPATVTIELNWPEDEE